MNYNMDILNYCVNDVYSVKDALNNMYGKAGVTMSENQFRNEVEKLILSDSQWNGLHHKDEIISKWGGTGGDNAIFWRRTQVINPENEDNPFYRCIWQNGIIVASPNLHVKHPRYAEIHDFLTKYEGYHCTMEQFIKALRDFLQQTKCGRL